MYKYPAPICDKRLVNINIKRHIIQDFPEFKNALLVPDNLAETLNDGNSTKILAFLTKINII